MKNIYILFILFLISSSIAYSQKDTIFTTVSGDSVTIWHKNVKSICEKKYRLSISMLDSNRIVLTETDTSNIWTYCYCWYDFSATLSGLDIGHYIVDVYRQYLVIYGYSSDTTKYIGSTNFDILESSTLSNSYQYRQSKCGGFTDVEGVSEMPVEFNLDVNYPNPFNPSTTIAYQLPRQSHVTLKVYDVLGREVATLVNGIEEPGNKTVSFNAGNLPSGVYYYRLQAGNYIETKKLVLLK
jgi:hypothetical protein